MKYFRVFETESNYTDFVNGSDYVTPNLCVIRSTGGTKCKPYIPPPPAAVAGDVAYWDGSKIKTTPYSKWNTSLGAPVGVVVVPEGFAPDGRARIIGLKPVDNKGNQSSSHVFMQWKANSNYVDTELINYTEVPTTDNAGSTSTGFGSKGYLPSDKFTGTTSYVDTKAKYSMTSNLIPSPYLGESPNPEYYKEILSNGINVNALSDFNGLSNTEILVGLGSDYVAANAAWKYKDGTSNLQWHLPAMGEFGYLMPRFNEINSVITALDGVAVKDGGAFWSSSEYNSEKACYLSAYDGSVGPAFEGSRLYVYPFAILDNGENNGGGKIVNHGHIGQSTGYYIEWEYPVSSPIRVVFNTYTPVGGGTYELLTSINASKSGYPITFGPGESLTNLRSISPIEDDTYIYEIIIEG